MIRILVEVSLPAHTLPRVAASLHPEVLPPGVTGRVDLADRFSGCQSPAQGGEAVWTPCWIILEAAEPVGPAFVAATRHAREVIVAAAQEGGVELFAVAANAQIGDEYYRFDDILDVLERATH